MSKSPIANWQPKTEQGRRNADLLKAHAAKKRAKTVVEAKKAGETRKSVLGSERSKQRSAACKHQLDTSYRRLVHVSLESRMRLPTDEEWSLITEQGQPLLMPMGSHDIADFEWPAALDLAKPTNRIDSICRSGTLRAALEEVRKSLARPLPLWIGPDSHWLCMWLPGCGRIAEAQALLSYNPGLSNFPKLYLPATWYTARRHGGQEHAKLYRSWNAAINHEESQGHFGCYVLVYLDRPSQRKPLYQSTVARLHLAGFGVVELARGVVFQPVATLVLHQKLTDQPLQRVPVKSFGGSSHTHWSFHKDEKVVLDFPRHADPSGESLASLRLSAAEEQQYQVLQQRMAAPFDLQEQDRP